MSAPVLPLFDITAGKHGGNPESEAAHNQIIGTKTDIWDRIERFAIALGTYGLTADELALAWNCELGHVAPRVTELKVNARLVETAVRRKTRTGCYARVVVAAKFANQVRLRHG